MYQSLLLLRLAARFFSWLEGLAVQGRLRVCERRAKYWEARGHPKLVKWSEARMRAIVDGIRAENTSYWRARVDMLEPGDPIPPTPFYLLEEP
jgi:hypothetical protein